MSKTYFSSNLKINTQKIFFILALLFIFQTNSIAKEQIDWSLPFKKCWDFPTNGTINNKVASDNVSNIFISFSNNVFISLNPENGSEIWRTELGGLFKSDVATNKKYSFVITSTESTSPDLQEKYLLRSINNDTGIINWQKNLDSNGKIAVVENSENIYFIGDNGKSLAININSGNIAWSKDISKKIFSYKIDNSKFVTFVTLDGVYLISLLNGETLLKQLVEDVSESSKVLVLEDNKIILGNLTGELQKFNSNSNNLIWKFKTGGSISNLAQTDQGILVGSFDNFLYMISAQSGKVKWKKRISGRININPLVTKDIAIVVTSNDNIVTIIDLKNGKAVNQINIENNDYFINTPLVIGNLLLLQTLKGVSAYSNSDCKIKRDRVL